MMLFICIAIPGLIESCDHSKVVGLKNSASNSVTFIVNKSVLGLYSDTVKNQVTLKPGQSIIAELVNHDLKAMRGFQDLAFDTLKIISNKDTIRYNGQNQIINALKEENGGFFIDVN